jgi:photosystem II stability/assembly factor-like uncharacterized protein
MAQMIQHGRELIRINTQKNDIEYSKDGGCSWHIRFSSECKGVFTDLYDNGSEILACTSKALYSSKDEGHSWHSRCKNSDFGEFIQLASDGQALLATTSKGLFCSKDGGHSWHRR